MKNLALDEASGVNDINSWRLFEIEDRQVEQAPAGEFFKRYALGDVVDAGEARRFATTLDRREINLPETPQVACLVDEVKECAPDPAISRRKNMLGRFAQLAVDFLKKEDGPTAVEYAVMLALIVAVIISVSNIGNTTQSTYENPELQNATMPGGS